MGLAMKAAQWGLLIILAGPVVAGFGYSYVYSISHGSLWINVNDVGLATDRRRWAALHDAELALKNGSGALLATAHTVPPLQYVVVAHPDPTIRDCRHVESQQTRQLYAECFDTLSRWIPSWIADVRYADITTPQCTFSAVPLSVERHPADWWLWLFPNPHVGGFSMDRYHIEVTVDSHGCTRPKARS